MINGKPSLFLKSVALVVNFSFVISSTLPAYAVEQILPGQNPSNPTGVPTSTYQTATQNANNLVDRMNDLYNLNSQPALSSANTQPEGEATPLWNEDWLQQINAKKAWGISRGAGVRVAVIDTGVDFEHVFFNGTKFWTNPGEIAGDGIDNDGNGFVDDIRGWNFEGWNDDLTDTNSHGTSTLSVLAGNNPEYGYIGVAPDAEIVALKVQGSFPATTAQFVLMMNSYAFAIDYAVHVGAKVISTQIGFRFRKLVDDILDPASSDSQSAIGLSLKNLRDSFQKAIDRNVVVVVAGGQEGEGRDIRYDAPSGFGGLDIIAVGGVQNNETSGNLEGFSEGHTGSTLDIVAPAKFVATALSFPGDHDSVNTANTGNSLAAPMVAGTIALMLSQDPTLSIQQIRTRLFNSATDLGDEGRDDIFGHGLLNVEAALRYDEQFDTTGDGLISAIDVLQIINFINTAGSNNPPTTPETANLDVNKDGRIGAQDVLFLVNYLNAKSYDYIQPSTTPAAGEGEGMITSKTFSASPITATTVLSWVSDLQGSVDTKLGDSKYKKLLDNNSDGVLSAQEVERYELLARRFLDDAETEKYLKASPQKQSKDQWGRTTRIEYMDFGLRKPFLTRDFVYANNTSRNPMQSHDINLQTGLRLRSLLYDVKGNITAFRKYRFGMGGANPVYAWDTDAKTGKISQKLWLSADYKVRFYNTYAYLAGTNEYLVTEFDYQRKIQLATYILPALRVTI